jgi:mannose-1-phosphate guanylyltransferase
MKAILLAGGLGTRLLPITLTTPKCLVSINGIPLLKIWIDKLINANVKSILINTHYLASQVDNFIYQNGYSSFVKLSYEHELLGTAGTLMNNLEFIEDDDCMLIHADNYCLDTLLDFKFAHDNRPEKCLMTMLTFKSNKPSECGIVLLDKRGIVTNFFEKIENPPGNIANGAIYILTNEIINDFKDKYNKASDFSNEIIPNYLNFIYTYNTDKLFIDIGTIDNYLKAQSS